MTIKVLKVHDNGSVDLQIDKIIYYGCYPISIDDKDCVKFSVEFEKRGVPVGHTGWDALGNIHIIKE